MVIESDEKFDMLDYPMDEGDGLEQEDDEWLAAPAREEEEYYEELTEKDIWSCHEDWEDEA